MLASITSPLLFKPRGFIRCSVRSIPHSLDQDSVTPYSFITHIEQWESLPISLIKIILFPSQNSKIILFLKNLSPPSICNPMYSSIDISLLQWLLNNIRHDLTKTNAFPTSIFQTVDLNLGIVIPLKLHNSHYLEVIRDWIKPKPKPKWMPTMWGKSDIRVQNCNNIPNTRISQIHFKIIT